MNRPAEIDIPAVLQLLFNGSFAVVIKNMNQFKFKYLLLALVALCFFSSASAKIKPSAEERDSYIRSAEVWNPIDVNSIDLFKGPLLPDAMSVGQTIECTFLDPEQDEKSLGGYTPKFSCLKDDGTRLKVKYGNRNAEVFSEVIGSRLLWALGFSVDRNYSVDVICRDCPENPWGYIKNLGSYERRRISYDPEIQERYYWFEQYLKADRVFSPAVIEIKHSGEKIENGSLIGWSFKELNSKYSNDLKIAAEQKTHRDALTLFMSILQHADSKPENQRLMCKEGMTVKKGKKKKVCKETIMIVQDLGWLFGGGFSKSLKSQLSRMRIDEWKSAKVWKDKKACIANVKPILLNKGLKPTKISEKGRQFLVDQFSKLSKGQIIDAFRAARLELQGGNASKIPPEDWAEVLIEKMQEAKDNVCEREG